VVACVASSLTVRGVVLSSARGSANGSDDVADPDSLAVRGGLGRASSEMVRLPSFPATAISATGDMEVIVMRYECENWRDGIERAMSRSQRESGKQIVEIRSSTSKVNQPDKMDAKACST